MINYKKITYNIFGDVVLSDNPEMVCSIEELEKRVIEEDEQKGFWVAKLKELREKGVLN